MRKFKIHVTPMVGATEIHTRTEDEIKSFGNVNNLVFAEIDKRPKRIVVKDTEKDRGDLTYDYTYEQWLRTGVRVEAENDPGYEDLTGYGSRTDGRFNRFYLGKSTGWIPIYLEILNRNSHGGAALMHEHRKLTPLYNLPHRR